ncbi:hypothetical protein [Emticicia fluvialis]|uniref:hypothetical protein n=1 Tax=Emticicia fluvialis TaxID=2974474 RepID=UPI0021669708|nr:hypothetical protein [Emticicia fluvialis]
MLTPLFLLRKKSSQATPENKWMPSLRYGSIFFRPGRHIPAFWALYAAIINTNKGDLMMTNQTETTAKKLPTHDVFAHIFTQGYSEPRKHKISSGWENKDGKGINFRINGTMYVIRENKAQPDEEYPNRPTHSVHIISSGRNPNESQWFQVGPGWLQENSNDIVSIINGNYFTIRKREPYIQ